MKKIAVVGNSTSSLPKEYVDSKENLYILPLPVMFDDKTYLDGIDIQPDEFYIKLAESDVMPTTSQPSIGAAMELFEKLVEEYDEVIYLTFSSALSGTYQTGVMAANTVNPDKIHVIDTLSVNVIEGYITMEVLRLIEEGKGYKEVLEFVESTREDWKILLVVEDLMHLHRGGRISAAAAHLGTALKLKPILEVNKSGIDTFEKIRTTKKAFNRMVEVMLEDGIDERTKVFIAYTGDLSNAHYVKELIQSKIKNEVVIRPLTPVIGAHTGNNSLGIAWFKMK